jgi:arylsulfatase A-like enzyme
MMKAPFLFHAVLFAALLAFGPMLHGVDKPNIVIFLVDDMGVMDTSVPFIGAWAKGSAANPHQKRLPIAAAAIQSQQAAVYDLFPTILALAGIKPPSNHVVDGVRLDTLLAGRRDGSREETFLMHYPHAPHRTDYFTCHRQGAWKVIYHYFPSSVSGHTHYQLFHLGSDPFEQQDLAASKPRDLGRMMQGLIDALEKHDAVYPVDKDGVTPVKPKPP